MKIGKFEIGLLPLSIIVSLIIYIVDKLPQIIESLNKLN